MKRFLLAAACLTLGVGTAHAQMTQAIAKARRAKSAADAHIAVEQNTSRQPEATAQHQASPKGQKPVAQKRSAAPARRGAAAPVTPPPAAKPDTVPSIVMRESFTYDRAGTRDPFASLLNTSDLRPALSDLTLIGILYDASGRRSVAIMRDKQNTLYRARVGQTLGRMRVAQIKPRAVIFTIEEFGMNRQDSLVLMDTTNSRIP